MSQNKIQHFPDNVINCCPKEENENESHKEKSYMEETIIELAEDNNLKEKHIEMLKKNNSVLLQEAMETENDLRNMITNKEKQIEDLRNEIEKTTKKLLEFENKESISASTQTLIRTSDSYVQTRETSTGTHKSVHTQTYDQSAQNNENIIINETNEHRISEDETIISLDDDSSPYLEISADEQYLRLNQNRDHMEHLQEQHIGVQEPESESKCKMLITGDEYARNFVTTLGLVMDTSNWIMDEVIKPKSELCDITKELFSKVLNYNSNDFVIIMFDTKNVSNNRSLRYSIKNMLPISKYTNLVIMSKLNQNLDQILIKSFNRRIRQFKTRNINCSLDFFVDKGGIDSKYNLIKKIETIIKCPRISNIVLKSVTIDENVDENFFRQ